MARRIADTLVGSATPSPPHRPSLPVSEAFDLVLATWAGENLHSEQTLIRMSETVRRFESRLVSTHVNKLADITPSAVGAFVDAPTRTGQSAALATRHARRTAVRTLYRTARALGLTDRDPTLDIRLPPRGNTAARPLSDDEITLCRASAQVSTGRSAGMRTAAWALGEATAVSSEITEIRIRDLDNPTAPQAVQLPGTRRHDPRTGALTGWASQALARRVRELRAAGADDNVLLAYGGRRPPGGAKAQAAVCMALRGVLDAADLAVEADVRPASLRNWAGRRMYDAGTPVEQAARALGARTLDSAAEDIGLRWRETR